MTITDPSSKRPSVSIAMATYNGARFLAEQLESFAVQSRLPDELVACDDASTDDTVAILEAFRSRAPFPVHIHLNQANVGYIKNFEKALSLCEGDIIFLSDQDDVWFRKKIAEVVAAFENNPNAMVVMNDQIITDAHLIPSQSTKLTNIRRYGARDDRFVTGCCSAHRREWHSIVLPIPSIGRLHDGWINGVAHWLGAVYTLDQPLQYYRRHGGNASEGIFNSTKAPGKSRRLAARLAGLRSAGFRSGEQPQDWRDTILKRLAERRESLSDLRLATVAEAAAAELSAHLHLVQQRQHIWRLPRVSRLAPIAGLWRSGAYDRVSGWRSAVGDLVRAKIEA